MYLAYLLVHSGPQNIRKLNECIALHADDDDDVFIVGSFLSTS